MLVLAYGGRLQFSTSTINGLLIFSELIKQWFETSAEKINQRKLVDSTGLHPMLTLFSRIRRELKKRLKPSFNQVLSIQHKKVYYKSQEN